MFWVVFCVVDRWVLCWVCLYCCVVVGYWFENFFCFGIVYGNVWGVCMCRICCCELYGSVCEFSNCGKGVGFCCDLCLGGCGLLLWICFVFFSLGVCWSVWFGVWYVWLGWWKVWVLDSVRLLVYLLFVRMCWVFCWVLGCWLWLRLWVWCWLCVCVWLFWWVLDVVMVCCWLVWICVGVIFLWFCVDWFWLMWGLCIIWVIVVIVSSILCRLGCSDWWYVFLVSVFVCVCFWCGNCDLVVVEICVVVCWSVVDLGFGLDLYLY